MWTEQSVQEWIDTICREYSRSIGRSLTFDPHGAPIRGSRIDNGFPERWRTTISDGTRTVGVLKLRGRAGHRRDAEFLKACETAELAAQLIERLIISGGGDSSRIRESELERIASHESGVATISAASIRDHSSMAVRERVNRLLDGLVRMTQYPAAALACRNARTGETQVGFIRSSIETLSLNGLKELPKPIPVVNDRDFAVFRKSQRSPEADPLPPNVATGAVQRLMGSRGPVGALWIFDRRDRRLTSRDRHALRWIAERLTPLVEHATLLEESSDSRTLKSELRVASQTQNLPAVQYSADWFEVASRVETARDIGGDLMEVLPLPRERVLVAVGDAAGHSIPAALVMASVRGALRAMIHEDVYGTLASGQILERLNHVLHSIVQSHQFMTIFCGIFARPTMTLEYANAGHPQPLILRNKQIDRLTSHGLVLGVASDVQYESSSLPLQPGDVLALYTDGVTEAVNSDRVQYGTHQFEEALSTHRGRTAPEILDELWSSLKGHVAGDSTNGHDDRTLAVVRIAGA